MCCPGWKWFFFLSRQTTFPPEGSPFSHRQFQQRKANKSCVVPCLLCTIIHGSIQQASYLLESRQAHFRTPQPLHRFHGPFDRSCHSCWKPASIVDLFAFVLIWLTVAPSGMVNVLLMVVVLWVLVQLSNQARSYCEPQQRPKEKERQESSNPPRSMLVLFLNIIPLTILNIPTLTIMFVWLLSSKRNAIKHRAHSFYLHSSLLHGAGLLVYDPHTTQHKPVK